MNATEAEYVKAVRQKLWNINPALGQRGDEIMLQSVGLGANAPVSFTDLMRMLSNGLGTASNTLTASVNNYYDAQTAIAQAQAANAAGVPVAQYVQAATIRNQAADLINPGTALGSTVLGVPIWLLVGGVAALVLLRK